MEHTEGVGKRASSFAVLPQKQPTLRGKEKGFSTPQRFLFRDCKGHVSSALGHFHVFDPMSLCCPVFSGKWSQGVLLKAMLSLCSFQPQSPLNLQTPQHLPVPPPSVEQGP